MHKVAPAIERATTVPLLHVVDATATAIQRQGLQRVGLLGTTFTMSDGFYTERMAAHGIQTIVPTNRNRQRLAASSLSSCAWAVWSLKPCSIFSRSLQG